MPDPFSRRMLDDHIERHIRHCNERNELMDLIANYQQALERIEACQDGETEMKLIARMALKKR